MGTRFKQIKVILKIFQFLIQLPIYKESVIVVNYPTIFILEIILQICKIAIHNNNSRTLILITKLLTEMKFIHKDKKLFRPHPYWIIQNTQFHHNNMLIIIIIAITITIVFLHYKIQIIIPQFLILINLHSNNKPLKFLQTLINFNNPQYPLHLNSIQILKIAL
jgi:hypothetical protein